MTHAPRWIRLVAALFLCCLALAAPLASRAVADDADAISKVTKLNKKAIEEYENLNFEEARKLLKEALDLATQAGLDKHPIKARTHIHLGIVILAGFKQKEVALKQFRRALDIQPDIKLTKMLANPEIQEAFDEAVAGGGSETEGSVERVSGVTPQVGITHQPVAVAPQGTKLPVKATVDPSVGAEKVVLFYKPAGAADFSSVDMAPSGSSTFAAEIPISGTSGNQVLYYIEAQGGDGTPKATRGVAADPLTVSLKGAGVQEEGFSDDEPEADGKILGGKLFFGLMVGSGVGWTTGNGEVNVDHEIDPPGFAPSQLGHLAPEIGFFVNRSLLLSLQGRFQLVTGATPEEDPFKTAACGADFVCRPANGALALFARATWLFGTDKLQPFASFALGGGYIRHVAEFKSAPYCGTAEKRITCVDTVPAGPVLLGPGGGILYNVTPKFGLLLGVNAPIGFPKFTFHIDVNAGVSLRL